MTITNCQIENVCASNILAVAYNIHQSAFVVLINSTIGMIVSKISS